MLCRRIVPLLAVAAAHGASAQQPLPPVLVFDSVTVVDVEQGKLLPVQRVVIDGHRIRKVGAAGTVPMPAGARVVDAQGKYLVPGFWDMHAHVDNGAERAYPGYIAHGVTGIREMEQIDYPFPEWQREVAAGTRVGPRSVGASLDVSFPKEPIGLDTPEDARRIVDSMKAAGDAFLKFHGLPDDPDIFFALLREARLVGLPMIGHVPESVTIMDAADSGMRSVEHLGYYHPCFELRASWSDSAGAEPCKAVADALVRNGTWLTPTLIYQHYFQPSGDAGGFAILRLLRKLGVTKLLTGSDEPIFVEGMMQVPMYGDSLWEFRPGLSLLEEMVMLGTAGLPSLEVLQAATLNPARYLNGTDSLGTVADGKLADLVLLDADPLADIHNVMHIRAVVANGRYFDRAALDALDPDAVKLMRAKHYRD